MSKVEQALTVDADTQNASSQGEVSGVKPADESSAAVVGESETAEPKVVEPEIVETAPTGIAVEIAYALPDKQVIIPLTVEPGTTLEQAVERSGIMAQFPEIDLATNKVGIFGKLGKRTVVLREKDRVEIYRKLIADPKKVRKERAAQGKVMKKGGSDAE